MTDQSRAPILVTGGHRTGTTWVGRMLAAGGEAGYMHEPFNPNRWPGWMRERVPHWYEYVHPGNDTRWVPVVEDLLRFKYPMRHLAKVRNPLQLGRVLDDLRDSLRYRVGHKRPLLKDPIALFSSEWLADRFGTQVIVMIRHPAAFASSLKRLNWKFHFKAWLEQPDLVRDRLGYFEADMRRIYADETIGVIDQAILMWRAIHHVVDGMRARRPDWAFVRHEDLARDPMTGFRDLYQHAGLSWNERAETTIRKHSSAGNPQEVPKWRHTSVRRDSDAVLTTWKTRLTPDEIDRIRAGVADVAPRFYPEEEWS